MILNEFTNYQIDEYGNITNKYGKLLKPNIDKDGYNHIGLFDNGNRKWRRIHRLVATTFIPNPENKPQVNHKDGNKKNNHISNLEWCTDIENKRHAHRTGLYDPTKYNRIGEFAKNNLRKSVIQMDLQGNTIKIWEGVRLAEQEGNFLSQLICRCCKGERKTHRGFMWKYAD